MAYGRRSTYRRKGRRGNRSLSTRNIFNRKGAKAQAKQIYALRKSVNRVARMCKPEVKTIASDMNVGLLGHPGNYPNNTVALSQRFAMPYPPIGAAEGNRIGDLISALPLKIYFSSQYKKIINSVTTPSISKLMTTSGGVRMIVVQSKSALNTAPGVGDLLEHTSQSQGETVGMLNSPFISGITARFHILYNKVMYYSENHLIRCKNLAIKPVIKRVRWEDGYQYPLGHIWVFLVAGGFTVINYGTQENPYDYDVCDYSIKFELPFTDA